MREPSGRPQVPIPADEPERLVAVRSTGLLDTASDPLFDTITDLVAAALGVPIALVTLIDEDRQWFASRHGLDITETPREHAFCAHAIMNPDQLFIVEDASADERFEENPLVTGSPGIRFYAGAPVRGPDDRVVGSLCVIDSEPRQLDPAQQDLLHRSARQVEALLSARIESDVAVDEHDRIQALQVELHEAAEARNRFLAVAQHKLKTPLAVISGWSAMLQKGDVLSAEEHVAGLEAINRSTVELQVQINDLLDEARSRVLEQSLRLEPVELTALIEEQVSALRSADRHPVDLVCEADVWVRADETAVRQVLAHLLDNAVKYSPDGGAITISTQTDGGRAIVTVEDQGIGLPDGIDVFEPFQRGSSAPGVARGTGLGLYIVRSLMTSMHGDVSATSASRGTSVQLSFPVA